MNSYVLIIMYIEEMQNITIFFFFMNAFAYLSRTGSVESCKSTDYKSNALVQRRISTGSCLSMRLINLVLAMQILMVKLCLSVSIFIYFNLFIKQKDSNYKCHKSQSN